jgi:hypothetical protein
MPSPPPRTPIPGLAELDLVLATMLSYELTAPKWGDVSTTMRVSRPAP